MNSFPANVAKRVAQLLILFLLLAAVAWNLFSLERASDRADTTNEINKIQSISQKNNADTDADGLLDWEEYLYGTDPELADTDSDGFSDKAEIDSGSDALIFGTSTNKENIVVLQKAIEQQKKVQLEIQQELDDLPANIFSDDREKESFKRSINSIASVVGNGYLDDSDQQERYGRIYSGIILQEDKDFLVQKKEQSKNAETKLLEISPNLDPAVRYSNDRLATAYGKLAISFAAMHDMEGLSSEQQIEIAIQHAAHITEWTSAIILIHKRVTRYGVRFSVSEPGYFFTFSL